MPQLRWFPPRICSRFVHCHSLSRPMHNTSACNTSSVRHPALSRLPGRSDFAPFRICPSARRNRTDEAHVCSEAKSKVLVLCIVSIERLCIQRFGSSGHNRSQYADRQSQRTGFRKDKIKTQGLFDPRACTSQDCTTELCLSVDKLKKKNKQQGRQRQGRDGISVHMSMSM